jgi:peptidoglycan LD-endopeptidase CwlK
MFGVLKTIKNNKTLSGAALTALVTAVFAFSPRSVENVIEVRPELQMVTACAVQRMESPVSFIVVDGLRTVEEHAINIANGRSWIKRSRHQDGAAIDFAATINGKVTYNHAPYYVIADEFKECSKIHGYPIIWGGDWKVKDMMHIELDRKVFP